jgi:polyisoprenoid-binding protein YceI
MKRAHCTKRRSATATSTSSAEATSSPFSTPTAAAQPPSTTTEGGDILLEVVPEESEARFLIGEILRGEENTVLGSTRQVRGKIRVVRAIPPMSSLGIFQIDARSLATDSGMRDRAIANFILQSGTYESIIFEATSISGIPRQVTLGETLTLQIEEKLTIRDITRTVTFEAAVTPVSESLLAGSARATILRGDFNLGIPSVPSVASLEEEVTLEIDLVARPVGGP